MPLEIRLDPEHRWVVAEGHGAVSLEDMLRYQQDVWSRPDVAGWDELVDMSDVQEAVEPTAARMQELAALAATMDHARVRSRLAVVAPQHEFFGLARMYEAYRTLAARSTKEVSVFRDRAAALAWLAAGADPDPGKNRAE